MLKNLNQIFDAILFTAGDCGDTTKGVKIDSVEELDRIFLDRWGYDTIEEAKEYEGEAFTSALEKCHKAFNDGYTLISKSIDDHDDVLLTMLRICGENDLGMCILSGG